MRKMRKIRIKRGARDWVSRSSYEYSTATGWQTLKAVIKHRWLNGERLAIDISLDKRILACGEEPVAIYNRKEVWTKSTKASLISDGYRMAEGFHDSILWWGVRQYIRINGGKIWDISVPIGTKKDQDGREVKVFLPRDTAATLNDTMESTSTSRFLSGLSKIKMPAMDIQKMVMMIVLAIGMVFGLHLVGVF